MPKAQGAQELDHVFLNALLENVMEGIVACDAQGRLTLFNRAAREFHGQTAESGIPRERWAEKYDLFEFDGTTPLPLDRVPLVRAMRGEVVHRDRIVIAPHGLPKRLIECNACALYDSHGAMLGAVAMMRDITDEQYAFGEMHLRAKQLEAANEELRNADRYKDEFLSVISHELRTPLNYIMGFASILDDELGGTRNQSAHSYVAKILQGADRMLLMVNNLLDMSAMAAGEFRLSLGATSFATLVDEVVTTLNPLAVEKQLTLVAEVGIPGEVWLDGARVIQVLSNLVENAIKFTPEGGRIVVHALRLPGAIRCEVRDTGPGIASQDIPKLFTRFRQLDMTSTRRVGGVGLGLSIAKAIVEAHGGSIGVRSPHGQGCTFWFELPQPGDERLDASQEAR